MSNLVAPFVQAGGRTFSTPASYRPSSGIQAPPDLSRLESSLNSGLNRPYQPPQAPPRTIEPLPPRPQYPLSLQPKTPAQVWNRPPVGWTRTPPPNPLNAQRVLNQSPGSGASSTRTAAIRGSGIGPALVGVGLDVAKNQAGKAIARSDNPLAQRLTRQYNLGVQGFREDEEDLRRRQDDRRDERREERRVRRDERDDRRDDRRRENRDDRRERRDRREERRRDERDERRERRGRNPRSNRGNLPGDRRDPRKNGPGSDGGDWRNRREDLIPGRLYRFQGQDRRGLNLPPESQLVYHVLYDILAPIVFEETQSPPNPNTGATNISVKANGIAIEATEFQATYNYTTNQWESKLSRTVRTSVSPAPGNPQPWPAPPPPPPVSPPPPTLFDPPRFVGAGVGGFYGGASGGAIGASPGSGLKGGAMGGVQAGGAARGGPPGTVTQPPPGTVTSPPPTPFSGPNSDPRGESQGQTASKPSGFPRVSPPPTGQIKPSPGPYGNPDPEPQQESEPTPFPGWIPLPFPGPNSAGEPGVSPPPKSSPFPNPQPFPIPLPAPGNRVQTGISPFPDVPQPPTLDNAVKQSQTEIQKKTGENPSPLCRYDSLGISRKVDQANTTLNTVNTVTGAMNLFLTGTINTKLGDQVPGGIGGYMKKAWEATRMDKVINLLTLITALHNAAQLTRGLADTLGDVTSQVLTVFGVKDEQGAPIDVNQILGQQINAAMAALLGEEVWAGTKLQWLRANRIIQSASNIVWTIRSIADSAQEIHEWTAENLGKIGNALKKYRVVGERAYKWMPEKFARTDAWMMRIERFRQQVEDIDDAASSLSGVIGEVQNIQEEFTELKQAKDRFQSNVQEFSTNDRPDNTPIATQQAAAKEASAAPATSLPDREKGESNATP